MKVLLALSALLALAPGAIASVDRADAAIHEIVAAYCSGGGHGAIDADGFLDAPGVSFPDGQAPAQPVIASGAVDLSVAPPVVTDKPNVKFEAGTSVTALGSATVDHPSADHCPGAEALP